LILRKRKKWGLLLAQDAMLGLPSWSTLHVDVVPEADGSFTLWLRGLEVGGHGPTLRDARLELLGVVRSFISDYLAEFDFHRHLSDRARLASYVASLSLARSEEELAKLLFPPSPPDAPSPISQSVA
jgi:hypothetical protein